MAIRATVTFIKAVASADYVNVSAEDFVLRPQLVTNPFYFDTVPLSDVAVIVITKPLTDNFGLADVRIVDLNKLEADSISFSETVVTSAQMQRAFTDNFGMGDAVNNITTGKNLEDNPPILDVLGYLLNKSLVESTPLTDLFSSLMSKIETDSFGFTELVDIQTGRQVLQNDIINISDIEILNIGKGIVDTVPFNDIQVMQHNKVIADSFILDDSALINKDYVGNKENVFSFNDTISITTIQGRALGNMVLGSTQFN